MRKLVDSLKRLYKAKRLTKEQLKERVTKGTISTDEYEKITGEVYELTADTGGTATDN